MAVNFNQTVKVLPTSALPLASNRELTTNQQPQPHRRERIRTNSVFGWENSISHNPSWCDRGEPRDTVTEAVAIVEVLKPGSKGWW